MDAKVLVGLSYEDAVQKARSAHGDRVRILRRRDIDKRGFLGLGRTRQCEITFYVADRPAKRPRQTRGPAAAAGAGPAPSPNAGGIGGGDGRTASDARAAVRSEVCSYSEFFEDSDRQKNRLIEEERQMLDAIDMGAEADLRILDPYLKKTKEIMSVNAFAPDYSAKLAQDIKKQLAKALPELPDMRDFEVLLLDNIVSSFESDHGTQLYPPKFFVLAGGQGVGKTATSWKIGNVFASGLGKSVEVARLTEGGPGPGGRAEVEIDPNGVRHSVHSCQESLDRITGPTPMDIYIIDSFSPAQGDERSKRLLFDFYKRLPREDTKFFLVMEASTTAKEAEKLLSMFEKTAFQSIVLTKCDAAGTIGNAISVCSLFGLPLLFICDGKNMLSNISFASSFTVLSKLRGFDLDMNALAQPKAQDSSDPGGA